MVALTSMWLAEGSCSSAPSPGRGVITAPGRALVARTSPRVTAHRGNEVDASAIHVLPPAIAGAMVDTRPIRAESSGTRIETTPVGSSTLKLKCELLTGFTLLNTCWYLSHQPA